MIAIATRRRAISVSAAPALPPAGAADHAFQIFSLQAARRNRVVWRLAALLEELEQTARLLGGACEHVGKEIAANQPRARASHQHAVGLEHVAALPR